jgi:hypothetical protein
VPTQTKQSVVFISVTAIISLALVDIGRIDHLDQASIEGLKAKLKEDLNTFLTNNSEEQIACELRPYPGRLNQFCFFHITPPFIFLSAYTFHSLNTNPGNPYLSCKSV